MNKECENFRRPHLTKEFRLPNCYKEVEKILKVVKRCEANVKTVLHNSKLRRNVFNKVYALTFNVLKQSKLLNAIIKEIQLLEKEPSLRKELAEIMIHELIFGKGLPGKSKPVEIIKKYQLDIEKAYNDVTATGNLTNNDFQSLPKYARINTLVITMPEVVEDLEYSGFKQIYFDDSISEKEYFELVKNLEMQTFMIDYHFKELLVFRSDERVASWPLYQNGSVFIQDKSSFIPAHVLAPEPGTTVLDACAAPGMKTLHLTALMENKGTLYAFERNKDRFEILKNMLNSGHAEICHSFCEDFNSIDVNDEKFSSVEYILLDPSCSGSGMVNRIDSVTDTEDSKNEVRIQKLAGFQIIMLKHALQFPSVKRVVYSTCSITETENEFVVHEVLSHFSHKFKLSHILPDWPIRGSEKFEFGPLCVRAYPEKCLTNGFFVAMFERIECCDEQGNFSSKKKSKKHKKKQSDYIFNDWNYKQDLLETNFDNQTSYDNLKERNFDYEICTTDSISEDILIGKDKSHSKKQKHKQREDNGTDLNERSNDIFSNRNYKQNQLERSFDNGQTSNDNLDCDHEKYSNNSIPEDILIREDKKHSKKRKHKHKQDNTTDLNELSSDIFNDGNYKHNELGRSFDNGQTSNDNLDCGNQKYSNNSIPEDTLISKDKKHSKKRKHKQKEDNSTDLNELSNDNLKEKGCDLKNYTIDSTSEDILISKDKGHSKKRKHKQKEDNSTDLNELSNDIFNDGNYKHNQLGRSLDNGQTSNDNLDCDHQKYSNNSIPEDILISKDKKHSNKRKHKQKEDNSTDLNERSHDNLKEKGCDHKNYTIDSTSEYMLISKDRNHSKKRKHKQKEDNTEHTFIEESLKQEYNSTELSFTDKSTKRHKKKHKKDSNE